MLLIDEERNALLWLAYFVGDIVTFIFLLLQAAGTITDWWQWPLYAVSSFLMAQAWPLYWALLHWI